MWPSLQEAHLPRLICPTPGLRSPPAAFLLHWRMLSAISRQKNILLRARRTARPGKPSVRQACTAALGPAASWRGKSLQHGQSVFSTLSHDSNAPLQVVSAGKHVKQL